MYLPALPSIGKDLTTDPATVQMSLLAFFVTMGLGQIVVGPISDMTGRKGPMYLGLGLFAPGSIGSAVAPGTKMGRDSMSVVDGNLKVYGIENLRITERSITPRMTTGNTMAPCVIIGERAGKVLKADYKL
jgi:choline dehydrogenase-like flavoprotein